MDRIESWKDRDEINALGEPALVGGEEAIASRAGDLYEGTVVLLLPERGLALGDAEHVAAVQLGAVGGGEDAGPVGYVAAEDAGEDVLAPKVDDAAAVALPVDPLAVVLGDVPHGEGEHAGAVPQPPLEGALVNGAVGLPVHAVAVRQVLLPGPVVLVGLERPRRGGGGDGARARGFWAGGGSAFAPGPCWGRGRRGPVRRGPRPLRGGRGQSICPSSQ